MKRINPRTLRRILAEVADVAGVGCLVGAVWSWNIAAGVLLLGVCLLVAGWVIDR